MDLASLLHQHFGFREFRPNQQAVCEAAVAGRDVLLVMPTGAGKSLCYQLPGLVRGGTTLVLSPLIALMDDQAAKLSAAGHRVARIHSGLDREQSRQSCRDYLGGQLDFLFIAPERLRVPGFPEMLSRRKPALIAIDEAHCISGWGHDFRPDYRTLGDHLPALRPAPVIALTATATPTVQRDIVAQLRLSEPALFIHGFRRTNLAIEAVELSKPQRPDFVAKLLSDPGARPAIVYTPSRKAAEELAQRLGGRAAAYHAGLDPETRERVQRHFLSGELEIVVATIAFGMGVDKSNVRTVLHTAMPASVEGYYQEIGRAGRDGLPSRTILLHSFADRRMHEFFLDRDYPAPTEITRVAAALRPEPQEPGTLARRLRLPVEQVTRSLDRLLHLGVALADPDLGVFAAPEPPLWQTGYDAQIAHRRSQIDRMSAFTEGHLCRMLALVQHFGDTADSQRPCGLCDVCAPHTAAAARFREPTPDELDALHLLLRSLSERGRSVGRLFTDLSAGRQARLVPDRRALDTLLDALSRAGLLTLTPDTFVNPEGKHITYTKATLSYEGQEAAAGTPLVGILLRDTASAPPAGGAKRRSGGTRSSKPGSAAKSDPDQPLSPAQQARFDALRLWRKDLASTTGKPAFIILGDSVLRALSLSAPTTLAELSAVSGIGPDKRDRYGADILRTLRETTGPTASPSSTAPQPKHTTQHPAPQASPSSQRPSSRPEESAANQSGETPVFRQTAHKAGSSPGPIPPAQQLHRPEAASLFQHAPASPTRSASTPPHSAEPTLTPAQLALEHRLRLWRETEADRRNLPHFSILPSSTLRRLAEHPPRTLGELGTVLTREHLHHFGPDLLRLCTE